MEVCEIVGNYGLEKKIFIITIVTLINKLKALSHGRRVVNRKGDTIMNKRISEYYKNACFGKNIYSNS